MVDGIGIREADPADLRAIEQIQHDAGLLQSDRARLEAAIADPDRFVVVAEVDGRVAGWAKTHYWSDGDGLAPAGHYLGGLTVAPALRRGGIGGALTMARLEWIWDRAPEAWYVTNARNSASIELHRRHDFEEVARASRFHTTTFDGGVGILWRATARERQGEPISVANGQIAAICLAQEATLATRNTKDFADTGTGLIDPWRHR